MTGNELKKKKTNNQVTQTNKQGLFCSNSLEIWELNNLKKHS